MPNLETVTLPAGLTSIPKDAFANSTKLATVKFGAADAGTPGARKVTGEANAITLPKGITSIGQNAFASTKATTVDLSQVTGLTMINNYVFKDMASLAEVKLPSGLTTINQSAFQNDAALKKLSQDNTKAGRAEGDTTTPANTATFGSKLTSIGNQAFYGTGFTTVDLSAATGTTGSDGSTTPLSVGSDAFTNMADLTTVKLPKDSNINPGNFGTTTSATQT